MIKAILNFLIIIFLMMCGLSDYINRSVDIRIFIFGAVAGTAWAWIYKTSLTGIVPGLILIILSGATKEIIGLGDGIFYATCGMIFGLKYTVTFIFATVLICALIGLIFRLGRKQKLPMLTVAMPLGIAMVIIL